MKYKFSRFEDDKIKKYEFHSYENAKNWVDKELDNFKKNNRVKDELKDNYFIKFKSELEKILNDEG